MVPKETENNLPYWFNLIKRVYNCNKWNPSSKKQAIYAYFFQQLEIYQSDKSGSRYKLLWETIQGILVLEKETFPAHRVLIHSQASAVVLEAIQNYPYSCSWAPAILKSLSSFLQLPALNAFLISDPETLMKLLIGSLKIIVDIDASEAGDLVSLKDALALTNHILDILEHLPPSNEDGKVLILSDSLEIIITFMYICCGKEEMNIHDKLAKRIISIIFNMKSKKFETLLTLAAVPDEWTAPNSSLLKFFLSMQNLLLSEEIMQKSTPYGAVCADFMETLLSNFLIHNKSSLQSLKVVSLLFAVAGMDIPIVVDATTCCKLLFKKKFENTNESLLGISHLLKACSTVPQYFMTMAVPDGFLKPSMWLRGVSAALLTGHIGRYKKAWLKCFQCLLTISPTLLESDVLPLSKKAFLNLNVHSPGTKRQYCELFNTVIQAHSQLHQIPKFFVKLLLALTECIKENAGGKFIINGQILPNVQESIAKGIKELPYRQMIELWKIFIETYSTLEIMSEAFMANKNYMFFVAQLFSIFLLHAQLFQGNIPSNIYPQFSGLIEQTSTEIQKNISALKDTDPNAKPLQKSVLLLSFSVGEVKLLYNAYHEKSIDIFGAQHSENAFDLSIVNNYLDKEYANTLKSYLNGDDKILSVLVFQLLLQKVKTLQLIQSMSKTDYNMHTTISVVLLHLQKSSSALEPWDRDLCLVNDNNYTTVLWTMFFKVFPLVLLNLTHRDFYILCHSMQNVVLQDDCPDTGAKHVILSALKSVFVEDSKRFQTAFISALWNQENLLLCKKRSHDDTENQRTTEKMFSLLSAYHSQDLKYAQRTPKSNKNLGTMWNEIKEISDLLNNILLSESVPKDQLIVSKTLGIIKLFNSLPLECLLPGNQMKCITGLSFLFFLVPQSCKPAEAAIVAKEISSVMVSIFEGVRSIWLFDFVISGLYLKFVVKTLEEIIDEESDDEYDWAVQLIDQLISLIVKNVDSLDAIEQCISRLVNANKSRTTLITFHALLRKLSQILLHPHKQENYKNILLKISSVTCSSFVRYMKQNFNRNFENKNTVLYTKCYMQVIETMYCSSCEVDEDIKKECLEPLSSIVEVAVEKVKTSEVDSVIESYMLFLSKACKCIQRSSEIPVAVQDRFLKDSWKAVLSHFKKKAEKNTPSQNIENPKRPLPYSVAKICSVCFQPTYEDKDAKETLPIITFTPHSLSESEKETLRELSTITSVAYLSVVYRRIMYRMGFSSSTLDASVFHMFILVFRCVIDSVGENVKQPILCLTVNNCLIFLHQWINHTCSSQVCQTMISIPILDFISFVLKGNKGIPKDMLFRSLHCMVAFPDNVDVFNNNYKMYSKLFTAAWNVVYDLFMHHTSLVLESPAPFLAYVTKLLKSIVKAGAAENLSMCDPETFQQMQLCAQNMNRLLTIITRNKNEFAKLVPYLVADYVDTVQHITMESSIKDAILSGIHRLLDICSEDSIKMLAVNINYIGREIFSNLMKNYNQNKYTGAT